MSHSSRRGGTSGFQFVDFLGREAKADGVASLTVEPYTIHSTINAVLQRDTEAALQEGLALYEIESGRAQFKGPETNIADTVQKLGAAKLVGAPGSMPGIPAWQQALKAVRLPLYDVHWQAAVVLDKGGKRGDGAIHVGLADDRIVPLNTWTLPIGRSLNLYDVVYVHVTEDQVSAKGKQPAAVRAQLRVRPTVQGAALVLQNKTGRILAMAGSFSYPLSQLNRTSQTRRQPGSTIKPLTYLTALQKGLQPNTLVRGNSITFPPIGSRLWQDGTVVGEYSGHWRARDYWTPRNYNHDSGGTYTLRRGLENSVNVVTAHLLEGGIDANPEMSLDEICTTAIAAKIYRDCVPVFPFVLGAQPVRMIDLAAFYATIANEGERPEPHSINSIEANGRTLYHYPDTAPRGIGAADATSFYQLKTILQGVVARGTARAISSLSPYVAGKTGTTENAVDGWFIGFTNDVTVAVWVGYDNSNGKRVSLGSNETGARVALPIFKPIIEFGLGARNRAKDAA